MTAPAVTRRRTSLALSRIRAPQDRGELRNAPGQRGAGPHRHAPGRCPGGAPGTRQCSAAAAFADLRAALLRRSGRIELARVHLALADLPGARTLMREIDELLRRRPGLGNLAGQAQALRARLAKEHSSSTPGASALTGAELRLLPLLSTHLSFPEIATQMFLSPNTIKSQANSIYRKLGSSTRSQAVARSRDLGLLDTWEPRHPPFSYRWEDATPAHAKWNQ